MKSSLLEQSNEIQKTHPRLKVIFLGSLGRIPGPGYPEARRVK